MVLRLRVQQDRGSTKVLVQGVGASGFEPAGAAESFVSPLAAGVDRELWFAITSDLGGADRLSATELQSARRAVGLAIQAEQIEARLAAGGDADTAALLSLVNAFKRCA